MSSNAELLHSLKIDRSTSLPPSSNNGLWITLAAVAMLILLTGGAWAWLARDKGLAVRTATVETVGGTSGVEGASVLDASGYVVARRMATVSAKVTGKVQEVLIEEGMQVEAGQVLARLEPIDANADRALAQSQLQATRSQTGSVQAQLVEAEANALRLSPLVAQLLVSNAQYDQAVAQRDSLRAQLLTAQLNERSAADRLNIADNGLNNTVVRAPFSGVVIAKAAQPGEIVSPLSAGGSYTRTGICTIVDMESLEVEVEVNEAFIGRVQPKMPIQAALNAYPDWQIPGEVIAIIPTADRGKATVKVRVALNSKDPRIVPDMGVRVSFLEAAKPQQAEQLKGVRTPGAAVTERDGAQVAFVVGGDGTVQHRRLKVAGKLGDDAHVTEGLKAGETVVLDPLAELEDGTKVKLAEDVE